MMDKKSGVKSILPIIYYAIDYLDKNKVINKEQVIVKETDTINLYRVDIKFIHNSYKISIKRCNDLVNTSIVILNAVTTWEKTESDKIIGWDIDRYLTFNSLRNLIIKSYYQRDEPPPF